MSAKTNLQPTTLQRTGTDFIGLTNFGTGHISYINHNLITKFTFQMHERMSYIKK
jgi:hypothetical protein